jgi:hypothetical protein
MWVGHACGKTKISITVVMPSSTRAAARVKRPSTSSTCVVSSMPSAILAAISGGSSGTLYSSVKR